jgi:hypothetical protein
VQALDGSHASVVLENNAGVLYRGTKLVHWRQVALRLPKGAQSPRMLAAVHPHPPSTSTARERSVRLQRIEQTGSDGAEQLESSGASPSSPLRLIQIVFAWRAVNASACISQ